MTTLLIAAFYTLVTVIFLLVGYDLLSRLD